MKTASAPLTLCALLAFASCSDSGGSSRNCDADPVPVPEDFTAAGYLAFNDDLQSVFALETEEDSLALAKHYCAYGEDEGRLYREGGSSAAGSSSSYRIGECIRTLVPDAWFKFETGYIGYNNAAMVQGWTDGGVLNFFAGDWIVPEGYDCDYRIQVDAHLMNPDGTGDFHNLAIAGDPWRGENIDSTRVEKVTIYTGEETHSSFGGYSSVPVHSSAALPSSSSQGGSAAHCILNWFTESTFNSYFPNRHPNYTWNAFVEALKKVPNFVCGTAGSDVSRQKQELAAVFAHWKQEVADLKYIEEICGTNGTCLGNYNSDWSGGSYPPQPGKSYHGRGAKQISWPGNYGEFSQFWFGDKMTLLRSPERVMNEGVLAFASSFWFWTARGCDQAFWSTGFGATTKIINGGIECGGSYGTQAKARETYYGQYLNKLGASDSRSKSTGCGY